MNLNSLAKAFLTSLSILLITHYHLAFSLNIRVYCSFLSGFINTCDCAYVYVYAAACDFAIVLVFGVFGLLF